MFVKHRIIMGQRCPVQIAVLGPMSLVACAHFESPDLIGALTNAGLSDPSSLKLIVGGRRLAVRSRHTGRHLTHRQKPCAAGVILLLAQDDARPLRECGVTASSRILVLGGRSTAEQAELSGQEASAQARDERESRLQRLRTAAAALAKRSGDRCRGDILP